MPIVTDFTALLGANHWVNPRWNMSLKLGTPVIVTYKFLDASELPSQSELFYDADSTSAMTVAQRQSVRAALKVYESATGVLFVETKSDDAMVQIHNVKGSDYGGWSNYPSALDSFVGDGYLVIDQSQYPGKYAKGTFGFETILHELGHAMGLQHPHEGDRTLAARYDSTDFTLMSYNNTDAKAKLGPLDVQALKALYGEPVDTTGWSLEYNEKTQVLKVVGGWRRDIILGVKGDNLIFGRGGNDFLFGRADDDTMYGGTGSDKLTGGYGDDVLYGQKGNDVISGGVEDDKLFGGAGSDRLSGGSQNDTVYGGNGRDRAFLGPGNDVFYDDNQAGVLGQDTVYGGQGYDTLNGGGSHDVLDGGSEPDKIFGGVGDDTVVGGAGRDTLYGGSGHDRLIGGNDNDKVHGGFGRDTAYLGEGDDVFWDSPQTGYMGSDTVLGGIGNDTFSGGGGDDVFIGGDGQDLMRGGSGNDSLDGGAGGDLLQGGSGDDTLIGGVGGDEFVFADGDGADIVVDFLPGASDGDTLNLSGITEIRDFDDLSANHMVQSGADVVISYGASNSITLQNVQIADLFDSDFLF